MIEFELRDFMYSFFKKCITQYLKLKIIICDCCSYGKYNEIRNHKAFTFFKNSEILHK